MAGSGQATPPHHSAFCAASAAPGLMKFQGIHHLLLQQLLLKSRRWLILAMKLPQSPGEGINWLPGRLQGWISKGKSFRSWNQALLPLPGCKGATMTVVLPRKVGKMFWAGKARSEVRDSLRNPSFAVPASPSCRASH